MQRVAVLNTVALTQDLLKHAPHLQRFADTHGRATLQPPMPAVTCTSQSAMLTGRDIGGPGGHGIVGNGWFNSEQQEVQFWKQSNKLVQGPKVWDTAKQRNAAFTCANLFWWYNMYSTVDISVTPRPQYKADGRKIPDCYSEPADLRDTLQSKLGPFPLFRFWGPLADITSTQWIADAAIHVEETCRPTLSLVYLPHLDYGLQKLGPDHPDIVQHVRDLDAVAAKLLAVYDKAGVRVLVVNEYGIEPVRHAIPINRFLREAGHLAVRDEGGHELLDAGASEAFAVADHQVAHVYTTRDLEAELAALSGVAVVERIDHPRAGRYVLVAEPGHWFSYDYWLDAAHAPDFANTVDIHRKPGYDPRELFCDKGPVGIAWRLLRKKLGFRQLMDVIPLDASLVRGSHGRNDLPTHQQPILLGASETPGSLPLTAAHDLILEMVFST